MQAAHYYPDAILNPLWSHSPRSPVADDRAGWMQLTESKVGEWTGGSGTQTPSIQ